MMYELSERVEQLLCREENDVVTIGTSDFDNTIHIIVQCTEDMYKKVRTLITYKRASKVINLKNKFDITEPNIEDDILLDMINDASKIELDDYRQQIATVYERNVYGFLEKVMDNVSYVFAAYKENIISEDQLKSAIHEIIKNAETEWGRVNYNMGRG